MHHGVCNATDLLKGSTAKTKLMIIFSFSQDTLPLLFFMLIIHNIFPTLNTINY